MNRTKDEFLKRFRNHVAGVIALGSAEVRKVNTGTIKSVEVYGQVMNNLSETADQLLSSIYDYLANKEAPKPQAVNGAAAQPQLKVKS